MARHRIKKYSRRTRSQYKKSRAPIVLAVLAFLILSVLLSVLVGISLGKRAEENEKKPYIDLERQDYESNGKTVSAAEAYHFSKNSSAYDYADQEIFDLSVCIRHADGRLDYLFDTSALASFDSVEGTRRFSSLCDDAKKAGVRVCAYMYVTSFSIEDEYVREMAKAYELALIHEAALCGADDILLLGLEVSDGNIRELEAFAARAAAAAENVPLGVAVSEDAFLLDSDGISNAARLRASCDYLALDLTHLTVEDGESEGEKDGERIPSRLESLLKKYSFQIKTYPARLLFSREHSKLYIPALELGAEDLQIVERESLAE